MSQTKMQQVKSIRKEYYDNGQLKSLNKYTDFGNIISEERWYKDGVKEYYLGFETYKDIPIITGHREWWPSGNLKIENYYSKDKNKQIRSSWYKDGKLSSEENYENGIKMRREYHPNGKLKYQLIGKVSKEWDIDGNLIKEIDGENKREYHLNGELILLEENNIKKSWYPDGKLKFEYNYLNGAMHGIQSEYYPSGQLKSESEYDNGNGLVFKCWHDNSQLKYCKNIREDNYIEYYPDGVVKIDKDGKTYHPNGALHVEHIRLE